MKRTRLALLAALVAVLVLVAGSALAYRKNFTYKNTKSGSDYTGWADTVMTKQDALTYYDETDGSGLTLLGFSETENDSSVRYTFGEEITVLQKTAYTLYPVYGKPKINISTGKVELDKSEFTYNGAKQTPSSVTVTVGDTTLSEGSDYKITWPDESKEPGEKTITIEGKGDYEGTVTKKYCINKFKLPNAYIELDNNSFVYDGSGKCPAVTVYTDSNKGCKIDASDYVVRVKVGQDEKETVTDPGTYTLIVKKNDTAKCVEGSNETKTFSIIYKVISVTADKTYAGNSFALTNVEADPALVAGGDYSSRIKTTDGDFVAFDGCKVKDPKSGNVEEITIPDGWVGVISYDAIVVNKDGKECGSYVDQHKSEGKKTVTVYSEIDKATISVDCSETQACVTWENPDGAVKYRIYLDGKVVDEVSVENFGMGEIASYTFTQLEAGSTHSFAIGSLYPNGELLQEYTVCQGGNFTTLEHSGKVFVESFKVSVKGKKNLNGKTLTLEAGKQRKLIISTIRPKNATDLRMRYRSSNTDVCTVKNGMLVAKKAGTATITVTARSNSAAKVVFKVKVK